MADRVERAWRGRRDRSFIELVDTAAALKCAGSAAFRDTGSDRHSRRRRLRQQRAADSAGALVACQRWRRGDRGLCPSGRRRATPALVDARPFRRRRSAPIRCLNGVPTTCDYRQSRQRRAGSSTSASRQPPPPTSWPPAERRQPKPCFPSDRWRACASRRRCAAGRWHRWGLSQRAKRRCSDHICDRPSSGSSGASLARALHALAD